MLQPTENDWAVTQVVLADLEESFCSVTVSGLLVEVMGETGTQTFQIQLNDKLEGSSF